MNGPTLTPTPTQASTIGADSVAAKPAQEHRAELRITSVLNEGSTTWGRLVAPKGIRIKGRHIGHIVVPTNDEGPVGDILIDEGAEVIGVVEGFRVFNYGKIQGLMIAKEFADVGSKAVITDGVLYSRWQCREGSEVSGKVSKLTPALDIDNLIAPIVQQALESSQP